MILSALTSVGYIRYYIVRCILVHGARVQKSGYVSTEGKRVGGWVGGVGGMGKGVEDFLQWNRDRAGGRLN